MPSYSEKLRDPRWQRLRLEVMERDGFKCQFCFDDKSTLHVHHKVYRKGFQPWDYPADHLITLCELCHSSQEQLAGEMLLLSSGGPSEHSSFIDFVKMFQFCSNDIAVITSACNDCPGFFDEIAEMARLALEERNVSISVSVP
jgi:hypothetical protein